MSSHYSEDDDDNKSVASSPNPRSVLRAELPNTLPKLLNELQIDHENLHLVDDTGEMHVVHGFTDKKDCSEWVIRVAIERGDENLEEGETGKPTVDDHTAILRHLAPFAAKFGPMPKVTLVDSTNNNFIERPFMIESRMAGDRLDKIIDGLSIKDKRDVVDLVVDMLLGLETVSFAKSGTLRADPSDSNKAIVGRFRELWQEIGYEGDDDLTLEAWLTRHLDGQMEKKRAFAAQIPTASHVVEELGRLYGIMQDMRDLGYFTADDTMSRARLFHPDLHDANLFVKRDTASQRLRLSGIIDWDDTEARPHLLARQPPYFLWIPKELFDDDPLLDIWNADPEHLPRDKWDAMTDGQKQTKEMFDDAMRARCPSFVEDAYGRGCWIRRVAHFAMWGLNHSWDFDMLDRLCDEWCDHLSSHHDGKRSKLKQLQRTPTAGSEGEQPAAGKGAGEEGEHPAPGKDQADAKVAAGDKLQSPPDKNFQEPRPPPPPSPKPEAETKAERKTKQEQQQETHHQGQPSKHPSKQSPARSALKLPGLVRDAVWGACQKLGGAARGLLRSRK